MQNEKLSSLPISAKEARRQGVRFYFTGKPCPKGHICERSVSNRGCVICDKEITNAYCKKKYRENIVVEKQARQFHYLANKEKYLEAARRQREAGYGKIWLARNKGKWNAICAKRLADKLQRTPPWSEKDLIETFYKNCPSGYTVDHIFPLRGKTVSGLHVIANLQYLTKSQNSRKRNQYNPDLFPEQSL